MCLIYIVVCRPISVGTAHHLTLYHGELRQTCQPLEHVHHVRIREDVKLKQFAQITDCRRYAVYKMPFPLKISAEAIRPEHLHGAEKHEKAQAFYEVAHGRHLYIVLQ